MNYVKRFADDELKSRLGLAGAVLVTGAKACGKTETALQFAASAARFDTDRQLAELMAFDPERTLVGASPRLLDEWQEFPALWNLVRRAVDDRKQDGLFILTGSANPDEKTRRHSGAGRFSVMRMRPMSLFERGWSTGEVALSALKAGISVHSERIAPSLETVAERILFGGWPGLLGKNLERAVAFSRDYVALTAEIDISRVSEKRRDPEKVLSLMRSVARNLSTEASVATLAADARGGTPGAAFKEETAADYLDALQRLMIVEDLPAWAPRIRSSASLRKMPKRHFADPSIACGALNLDRAKMTGDLQTLGFLFESLAVRDLRIYAQTQGGRVFHYRDSSGLEVDAVVEFPDGRWLALEIKLGSGAADAGAENLLRFAKTVDSGQMGQPDALVVITANGFALRRSDGVFVIPLFALTA
jgi:predicted AAA+ superfamily ATPase